MKMMVRMVWQRIGIGIATLIVVSVIVFVATSILPGDVAEIILGQGATPETLAALRAELGMDHLAMCVIFPGLATWRPAISASRRPAARPFLA